MKNLLLTTLILIIMGFVQANNDEIFENFSSKYITRDVKKSTLLVIKYKKLDIDNPVFCQQKMDKTELLEFINKENLLIDKYNEQLEKLFKKHYNFSFLLIEENELKNYSSSEYPFTYKRYMHFENDEYVYSRFFMNRKDKVLYKDINLDSKSVRGKILVEKDIILALGDYLEE